LGDDVPADRAAAAQARPAGGLDLRADSGDPRAGELDPLVLAGHRGGVDHDLGAVAERAIRGALRARRDAHHPAVLPGDARAAGGQAVRNIGTLEGTNVLRVKSLYNEHASEHG